MNDHVVADPDLDDLPLDKEHLVRAATARLAPPFEETFGACRRERIDIGRCNARVSH